MDKSDQLGQYIASAKGTKNYQNAMNQSDVELSSETTEKMQKVMMRDWVTLTGKRGPDIWTYPQGHPSQPVSGLICQPTPSTLDWGEALEAQKMRDVRDKVKGDRPFEKGGPRRTPARGFLDLDEYLVSALTIAANLRWGAIELSGASGDVMHFDMDREKPGLKDRLKSAKEDYERTFSTSKKD